MTIDTLINVIPPPAAPFEAFNGPWEPIEAELGVRLPPDYKDFVRLYGSGYFMEFLGVDVPRSANLNTQLEHSVRVVSNIFREDDDCVYCVWPERGGLLPFGTTDNGDFLFWLMQGKPEDWGVVVWDRGNWAAEVFACDLTDFLAGLVTGEIAPKEFPEDLKLCDALFQPSSPLESEG